MEPPTELFRCFCDVTKNFTFTSSPETNFTGSEHEQRAKMLIQDVYKMAVKKWMQTSQQTAGSIDAEDWIQQALIVMFECCNSYDGKRPFENYVRYMVSKRMADIQRTLLRKNPPTDTKRLQIYQEAKKIAGKQKAIDQLAQKHQCTAQEIYDILATGVGERTFTTQELGTAESYSTQSHSHTPEEQAEQGELEKILLECIGTLNEIQQRIFRLHELKGSSLQEIFDNIEYDRSFATFKRWYKNDIYERVKNCVTLKS